MDTIKTVKTTPEHRDPLGQILSVGDCVAYPTFNKLAIGKIKKLNPKMIEVVKIGKKSNWRDSGIRKYPSDVVKLQGPEVTMYLLKMNSET